MKQAVCQPWKGAFESVLKNLETAETFNPLLQL